MAAQHSAGIQTLLDAEREALKIVRKAREFRIWRIKEARDEAKAEIDAFRASKEDEFKKFEIEHSRGNHQAELEASKETDAMIQVTKTTGQNSEQAIVKGMLKAVLVADGQRLLVGGLQTASCLPSRQVVPNLQPAT